MAYINILDIIYPVGSVYITTSNMATPAQLVGGSWTRIEGSACLAAGSDGYGGQYFGSSYLAVSQIPGHRHTFSSNVTKVGWEGESPMRVLTWSAISSSKYIEAAHNVNTFDGGNPTISSTGGGNAFHPYSYCVYAWVRTA